MPRIKLAIGVSPENADKYDDDVEREIMRAAQSRHMGAIGSCGLTAHGNVDASSQEHAFSRQIEVAKELNTGLVVEVNGAHDRAISLIESASLPFERVLVHDFDGSKTELDLWSRKGAYVSFGARSARDAARLYELAASVPTDRVLVESGAARQSLDKLSGYAARCDQVVYIADILLSHVSAEQLATNAATFYRL